MRIVRSQVWLAALAAERPGNSLLLGLSKDMLDWQGKKAS